MMIDKIKQDRKLLEKQLFWVEISFNECTNIGIKEEYTVEEFGKFETLCNGQIILAVNDRKVEFYREIL